MRGLDIMFQDKYWTERKEATCVEFGQCVLLCRIYQQLLERLAVKVQLSKQLKDNPLSTSILNHTWSNWVTVTL